MVSKKTLVLMIVATTVAVFSGMYFLGSTADSREFNRRLEEISKIRFIIPSGSTIESYLDWAELEVRKINSDRAFSGVYTGDTHIEWGHSGYRCYSWSEFKQNLLNALSDGILLGDELLYHEESRTIWFDTVSSRTITGLAVPFIANYWVTYYITIE